VRACASGERSGAIVVLKRHTLIAAPGERCSQRALEPGPRHRRHWRRPQRDDRRADRARVEPARPQSPAFTPIPARPVAAARIGAAESVVATDVIDEIPVGLDLVMELP